VTRILLVNPPFYRLWGSHYNGMMLGIASLVSTLRAAGHEAWMLNADYEPRGDYPKTRAIYEAAKQPFHPEAFDGLFWKTAEAIVTFKPDWVGYTTFSANYGSVAEIVPLVKWMVPDVVQIIGGPHATVDERAAGRIPGVKFQFVGEAEESLVALLRGKQVLPNVQTRIQDLGAIPPPDRTHWWSMEGRPMDEGELSHVNVGYISTARGCPMACTFCSSPRLWGRRVTYRSEDYVVGEFRLLNSDHAVNGNEIHVVDDTFTCNKTRAMSILRRLKDERLTAPWKCESRADSMDEEIAGALAKAGCTRVKMGFESGCDRVLGIMQKRETKQQMRDAVWIAKSAGLLVTGYFIAGVPTETDDELRQTIDFARSLELDNYSMNVFSPYPGSALYEEHQGRWSRFIEDDPWALFNQCQPAELNGKLSERTLEDYWSLSGDKEEK
jgi:anaerobic magnesium-protoporphyrin IX monomethyl ester cyclase